MRVNLIRFESGIYMKKTNLTESDYNSFYKTIIYGEISDILEAAIRTSYRDLCRTIRGFASHSEHDYIYGICMQTIYDDVTKLLKYKKMNQDIFDQWHRISCKMLVEYSTKVLTYGQAQKWINMTLKNLSMLNHKMVEQTYEFYHIPIDNYILDATKYELGCAWSKLNNYEKYLEFQKWFRSNYEGIPLDVEFKMWLDKREKK